MSANDRQVSGNHYRAPIQHWDYVIANGLGYFEGQITRYVTRWRKKNGLEDLLKAQHYLEKLIEEERAHPTTRVEPTLVPTTRVREWNGFAFEGAKGDAWMYQCRHCGEHVTVAPEHDPVEAHGTCAPPAYVAQG
jgi:hypothetical protein